jgi:putative endonuclease
MARHNQTGRIGEAIAAEFLEQKGFKIVSRNYKKPYGEIDLIASKGGKYWFIEVKSVSHETGAQKIFVPHEMRPEENVHPQKVQRLKRVIQVYLLSYHISSDWQFDIISGTIPSR